MNFQDLRKANVARCEQSFHPVNDWSPTDWSNAMAGEAGECCNETKKLRRLDLSKEEIPSRVPEELMVKIAKELGDVICYADLLAARLGISLEEATRLKFNEVSDRIGSTIKL